MLAKWMSCLSWCKSYHRETFLRKMAIFSLLSGGNTIDLRSNLWTLFGNSVKRAIECVFLGRWSSFVFRVMRRFVEKCRKMQNLILDDLWWPGPWPDLKNDGSSFSVVIRWLNDIEFDINIWTLTQKSRQHVLSLTNIRNKLTIRHTQL